MQVKQEEYQQLNKALVDAFTLPTLNQMVQFGLGERLDSIAAPANLDYTVFELIGYYNRRDRVDELVRAARRYNQDNVLLYAVAQSLGMATQMTAHFGPSVTPLAAGELEKLVRRRVLKMPAKETREQMLRVEGRMCVVERGLGGGRGEALGSGFLIGPDAILTNYHVVKNYLQGSQAKNLQVRFDAEPRQHIIREAGEGVTFAVEEIPLFAPYTAGDAINLAKAPAENELDFAILSLSAAAGDALVGGEAGPGQKAVQRGWMAMPEGDPVFEPGDPLIIYQYPGGRELMMAIDTEAVVETVWDGKRLRYRNNTENGSSGSPVFDMRWNLVALHHAGGPGPEPAAFNQGIPIARIKAYAEAQEMAYLFGG